MKRRFKVEIRGNSFVVYDLKENRTVKWFPFNCLSSRMRKFAEEHAKTLNENENATK
jgi:hypothetical protein